MTGRRAVHHLGDSALVADSDTTGEARGLARALSASWSGTGVEDVVTGFRSVTVIADPEVADMAALATSMSTTPLSPGTPPGLGNDGPGRRVEIPVAFDGPDLDDVARDVGLERDEVVRLLHAAVLEVAFVGFAPGFGYLVGLPPPLDGVRRRNRPRSAVPPGSVGLGGGFAGIYPTAMPGGWHLVGRTGMALFRPDTPPYAVLAPGDSVVLAPGPVTTVPPVVPRPRLVAGRGRDIPTRWAIVEEPGMFSVVQDGGRIGVAAMGVPRAGAADPDTLELANRLVGNIPTAAAVECTARGPSLRFRSRAHVAVVGGAVVGLDGHAIPSDIVFPVAPDQVLDVGEIRGRLRAYVAVDGGVDSPVVVGSRSSDVLCGLGPGRLRQGDELGFGPPARPHGRLQVSHGARERSRLLRVLAGPDPFPDDALDRLVGQAWTVADPSDRVGIRLAGTPLPVPATAPGSRGVVTGTVQVPPDGMPIVLCCDHATVGGYPVIAVVVRADLGVLGRCRPGEAVAFEVVDLARAAELRVERRRRLDGRVVGWFPTRSD